MRNVSSKRAKHETYAMHFRYLKEIYAELRFILLKEKMYSVFANSRRKDRQKGWTEKIKMEKEFRRKRYEIKLEEQDMR